MADVLTGSSHLCDAFSNPEFLKNFTADEQRMLQEEKKVLSYAKGENIIEEGHKPSGIYCVTKGKAKLYKVGFMGKEQIIRFLQEGDLLGYRSILSGEPFGASATALDEVEVMFIPERFFLKLLKESPTMSFEMLKTMSIQLGEAANTITLLAQKTVRERLAEILLLLEKRLGTDNEGYINIALTREEMANIIGTATESAIRLISEFKSDELIAVEGRRIKILDPQKLQKLGHVTL